MPPVEAAVPPGLQAATFAGGCFWCLEPPFDNLPGVISTTSGYMGGKTPNPTYKDVSRGWTGHAEVVQVLFDPQKVSYEKLLFVFWRQIDPTALNRQFVDNGSQYRTAIFYHSERQKQAALKSKSELEKLNKFKQPIVTEISPAAAFYPAEAEHQDYYKHHPYRYKYYRFNSGRDQYLDQIWGKNRPH
ncbi:MAG: peptide-methionine (S)-S-oxide reductase MsrA [Candidatus Sericytochromatia bacterium]